MNDCCSTAVMKEQFSKTELVNNAEEVSNVVRIANDNMRMVMTCRDMLSCICVCVGGGLVDDNKPEEPRCLIDTCKTTNTLITDVIRYIETLQRMIG